MPKETQAIDHKQETASVTKQLKTNKYIKGTTLVCIAIGGLIGTKPGKWVEIRDQEKFKNYFDSVTFVLEI